MEISLQRIEKLRVRLRSAFIKKHRNNPTTAAKERSTKVSERNPFLLALSTDLKDRFGDDSTGFSEYNLKKLFFNDTDLNYNEDTIIFLELFCEEIENIQDESPEDKSLETFNKPVTKSKRYTWLYITGLIVGILLIIYLVLSNMGNRFMDRVDEAIDDTLVGEFDPDPSGNGTGFFSIYDKMAVDVANKLDSISVPDLKIGEKYYASLFIDFRNRGVASIKNAQATVSLLDTLFTGTYLITATLSGDRVSKIFDTTTIINLPEPSLLKLVSAHIENTHGETDPMECTGYNYEIELSDIKQDKIIVDLDVLDTIENGWCDQGFVVLIVSLEKLPLD